ncbi:MAG: sugar phosphate nucleotidyltransferase [Polyangiaceae bacterium]
MSTKAPPLPASMQAVILAGGLATRMLPRTERVPKFLLDVAGRPFGARLLEKIAACGFDEVVLCIGHLGGAIRDIFGDGAAIGVRLRYSDEGEARLGTAGALKLAAPLLQETFLVTYGDSYLPFDYAGPLRDLRAHAEAMGTMAVYRNADLLDASNAVVSEGRVVRYEKRAAAAPRDPEMDHIDYGATALRREVLDPLPAGIPHDFSTIQRDLAASGRLRAHAASERFYEIGSEAGLRDLVEHVRAATDGSGSERDAKGGAS